MRSPPTTSTAVNPAVIASAIASARRLAGRPRSWDVRVRHEGRSSGSAGSPRGQAPSGRAREAHRDRDRRRSRLRGRRRRSGEDDRQRPALVHERLAELAADQHEAVRDKGPLSAAHSGLKNVYASKPKAGGVPERHGDREDDRQAGTRFVGQFAVMRKVNGRWRFIEYERSSGRARYTLLAQGSCATTAT